MSVLLSNDDKNNSYHLINAPYVPDIVLDAFHTLFLIPTDSLGVVVISILKMKTQRLQGVKWLTYVI